MTEEMARTLISQGGFAVLAAFLAFLGFKVYQQIQGLLKEVFALVERASAAQATMAGAIEGLRQELVGLRAGIHNLRDSLGQYELRIRELEARPQTRRRDT